MRHGPVNSKKISIENVFESDMTTGNYIQIIACVFLFCVFIYVFLKIRSIQSKKKDI